MTVIQDQIPTVTIYESGYLIPALDILNIEQWSLGEFDNQILNSQTKKNIKINNTCIYILSVSNQNTVRLCQELRATNPHAWVIAVNHGCDLSCRLDGYNKGIDDFIDANINPSELKAKLTVYSKRKQTQVAESVLKYYDLELNLLNREIKRAGRVIELRSKEFDLLKVFLEHPEQVLKREYIFNRVWGFDFLGDSNVIEVYVRYLRTKLGKPVLIKTKRGEGYVMLSEEAQIDRMNFDD